MLTPEQLALIQQCSRDSQSFYQILSIIEASKKELYETVREGEMRYRSVVSAVAEGVLLYDRQGELLAFNASALKILRIRPEQLHNLKPHNSTFVFQREDGTPLSLEEMPGGLALKTGLPQHKRVVRLAFAPEDVCWLEITAQPIFHEDAHRPHAVVVSFSDVTQRRHTEAALRESEEMFRQMAENIREVMYVADVVERKILYINPAYSTLWGRPHTELYENPSLFRLNIHPDDQEFTSAAFDQARQTGGMLDLEYRIVRDDGALHWVWVREFPIFDEQGQLYRVVGIVEDITDHKYNELNLLEQAELLEQKVQERTAELQAVNQQLLKLTRTRDEFVANVSHELRTPLTNLKLYHDLLRTRPERMDKYMPVLERETNRLQQIVENLLQLSRLDRDAQPFYPELAHVGDVVRDYLNDRQALAQQKGVLLSYVCAPDVPWVKVDLGALTQLVGVLLTNALNYSLPQGEVQVWVASESNKQGNWVIIGVQDKGLGFTADEEKRLFERFYRGESARLSNVPGTGLGLSIAQEIVQKHGGFITAVSPGLKQGAKFEVWLPQKT